MVDLNQASFDKLGRLVVFYIVFLGMGMPLGKVHKSKLASVLTKDRNFNKFSNIKDKIDLLDSLEGSVHYGWEISVDKHFIYVG